MPFFMVKCYAGGKAKGHPRKVEARDALEAAEKICNGSLVANGKLGQLRAVVSPLENPNDKTTFRDQNS